MERNMQSDLMITGVGVLSPIGIGYREFCLGLQRREPRFGSLSLFGTDKVGLFGSQLWDFDPGQILGRKGLRTLDRNTLLVLSCLQLDLSELIETIGPQNIGLSIGTTFGSFTSLSDFTEIYLREGFDALNPMLFPNLVINSPPSQGNVRFDLTTSSTTISNGFTSGLDAMIFSADRIRLGYEKAALCGGSEELSYEVTIGYKNNGWFSPSQNVRPFDQHSDGTLIGEGIAIFMLESTQHCQARGAMPLVEIVNYATCFDGSFQYSVSPEAQGGVFAIEQVLRESNIQPEEIGFIATSANGRPQLDAIESLALHRALGSAISNIPVVAYKAYWGECLGAASSLQLAAAIADLQRGTISGTPNVRNVAEHHKLWVPSEPLAISSPYALIFACGETGNFSAMLIKKSNTAV
jgi:3-oxoacyl-[acyl-carrier-protein] synthase II